MTTYIALLRAINVNGHNMIKMSELRRMFEEMGFHNVETYIQSGNVLFVSPEAEGPLRQKIEQAIQDTFGLTVAVVLRTAAELEAILADCPFADDVATGAKLYVSLLADQPSSDAVDALLPSESEMDDFRMIGRDVFILCRGSYHKSKYSNRFFEVKLKVASTSRNWQTVTKLVDMARRV